MDLNKLSHDDLEDYSTNILLDRPVQWKSSVKLQILRRTIDFDEEFIRDFMNRQSNPDSIVNILIELDDSGLVISTVNKDNLTLFFKVIKKNLAVGRSVQSNLKSLYALQNKYVYFIEWLSLILPLINDDCSTIILVIIARNLNLDKAKTMEQLAMQLDILLDSLASDLLQYVDLICLLFPVLPDFTIEYLKNDIFLTHLKSNLNKLSNREITQVLKLFNIALINEDSKLFINTNFKDYLVFGSTESHDDIRVYCSIILIRLSDLNRELNCNNLVEYVIEQYSTGSHIELTESISYISLMDPFKTLLRTNTEFLLKLMEIVDEDKFGVSTILANLALRPIKDSKNILSKKYSQDTIDEIEEYNEFLAQHDLIDQVLKEFDEYSRLVKVNYCMLFYSMSADTRLARRLTENGAVLSLLKYLVSYSDYGDGKTSPLESDNEILVNSRLNIVRCLTRLLIASNPTTLFKDEQEMNCKVMLPFIYELFELNQYQLDIFESLMAFTNLASLEDEQVNKNIISFMYREKSMLMDDFVISSNEKIQLASLQLISNLIANPSCLAKFFSDEDANSAKRLELLVELVNSESAEISLTVMGILANASDYELVSMILSTNTKLNGYMIDVLEDHSDDVEIIERAIYVLGNVLAVLRGEDYAFYRESKLKENIIRLIRLHSKNNNLVSGLLSLAKKIE